MARPCFVVANLHLDLQETIPKLFNYDSMEQAMLACAEPHVNVNYMHAPDFELQEQLLRRYMATVAAAGKERSLTLVLSVGYWVWTPEVPQVPPKAPSLQEGLPPSLSVSKIAWCAA